MMEKAEKARDEIRKNPEILKKLEKLGEKLQSMSITFPDESSKLVEESIKKRKKEVAKIHHQYKDFFRTNGIITPSDAWELLLWMEECANIKGVIHHKMEMWHLREFHKYKELQFKEDWTDDKERERMKKLLIPARYPGIAEKLSNWIEGATDSTLEEIIVNKRLPNGAKKLKWKRGQADAFRFMDWVGMTYPEEFKECFLIDKLHTQNKPEKGTTPKKGSIYYTLNTIR